ncbi:MAG: lipopolysaccharide biosynthesis protein, partial [Rhodobiaceae bacterium]|nr:lipopolysaccharide biosynthesis protein [Rhodobiaceae bacterium]
MRFDITGGLERHDAQDSGRDGLIARLFGLVRTVLTSEDDNAHAQRTAILAFVVRVASAFVLYAMQVVFARLLGGFEYGIFVFVWACVLIIGGISSAGFPLSVARFIPEYRQKNEFELLRGILLASRFIPFMIATTSAVISAAIITVFPEIARSYYTIPLLLAFVCIPAYTLIDVQDGMGRAHNWILLALLPPYILRPFLLLVFMVGTVIAGFEATAVTAMYSAIASVWLTALVQTLAINKRLRRTVDPGPRAHRTALWVKVSLPICLVDGFFLFMTNTDVLVLSYFRTPEETGAYFAAVKTLAFVSFVSFAVAAAAAHKFSEYYASGDNERLERFVRDSIVWTFWPSLAGTALIVAAGKPVLWLFGSDFVSAYPVMFIVGAGLMARAAVGPL